MKPAAIAIIGAGGIAHAHAAAIAASDRAVLRAVIDPDVARAQVLAAPAGALAFATLADVPASVALDVAVVCAPPVAHESLAIEALGRDLHVLCEKPFTIGAASARRIAEAAARSSRLVAMAAKFRYVDDVARARALVRSGAIGTVVGFDVTFAAPVDMRARWNAQPEISGGGVLIDNGSHAVDLVRYLLGPIIAVQAAFPMPVQPLPVEDSAQVMLRTRDGATGTIHVSWSVARETPAFCTIYGTGGTIELGWKTSRVRGADGVWSTLGPGYDKGAAFRAQIDGFAAAVREGSPIPAALADAIASVEVIDAAYASEREHRWLGVAPAAAPGRAVEAA